MLCQYKISGFTLIELLLVVFIIGLLIAVGYPNYQEQVLQGRRADAKNAIMLFSAKQERHYSDYGYYADIQQLVNSSSASGEAGHYEIIISCTPDCSSSSRPQQYLITATPTVTDSRCGTYQYNQAGIQTSSGSADENYCW